MKKLLITTTALLAVASSAFAQDSNGYQFDNAANVRDNLNIVYESFGGNFADLDSTIPQTNNGDAAELYGDLLEHIDEVGDSTAGSVPMPAFTSITTPVTPITAGMIDIGTTIEFNPEFVVAFTAQVSVDFVHISSDDVSNIIDSHMNLMNILSDPSTSMTVREEARDDYVDEYNALALIWNDAVDALTSLTTINATDAFTLGGVFNDTETQVVIGGVTYGNYTDWVTDNPMSVPTTGVEFHLDPDGGGGIPASDEIVTINLPPNWTISTNGPNTMVNLTEPDGTLHSFSTADSGVFITKSQLLDRIDSITGLDLN